jgi:DNA-binding CsgD family transcriptional regulator
VSREPYSNIGREAEFRRVEEFVGAVGGGAVALLLEGEIGIGKTTLWRQGISAARSRGYGVLACRPAQCETELPYAALGDLLAEVPDEALATLPAPQRRALEVALLRAEPEGQEFLQRAVALGTLGVLRALARERPTLVAIDDVAWLDQASDGALGFAARRLRDERIGLLVTRRVEGAHGIPLDLERALPDGRLRRVQLGPLDAAALDDVIAAHLGAALPKRTLARLRDASGGNPFFAVEMARALLECDGPLEHPDALPIPASLHELVSDRLALLPPPAREVARIVAALPRPTPALIDAALGAPAGAAVDAAVRAGVVELDGGQVGFTHPLLGSIAYAQIPPAEKQALHRRLATVLDDPEERARHLALAADRPDAEVAAALDVAARRAWTRGAPDSAATLAEQARRLTPAGAPDEARRRGIEAAERHFEAGHVDLAQALLEDIVAGTPPGEGRVQALARLGWVRSHRDGYHAGTEVFAAALAERFDDVALRIEIELGMSFCLHSTRGVEAAEGHARTALRLAEALGAPPTLAGALAHVGFLDSVGGRGIQMATIERALGLGRPPGLQILGRPDWVHALFLQWSGRLGLAREAFAALLRDAGERGDEHALPFILFQLSRVELLTGAWERARAHATECRETALQSGQAGERPYALTSEALVDAHLGMVEQAGERIDEGLRLAHQLGVRPAALELLAVRGFMDLSLGDAAGADRSLTLLADEVRETGLREPALFRFHGDAVEAKVALGRLDEARSLLDELDRFGVLPERVWARTIACRCRALLLAALGDKDAAYEALERALELHDQLEEPFERGRTLLLLGDIQRRDRKKRAARESLQGALEIFDGLGAALWSTKARAGLARVGGRAPAAGLTPTEQRVAELIASGSTYREAAGALFISPKTVQWNLSKIYRKLGVRSRAELAARLASQGGPSAGEGGFTPAERPVPR